MRELDTLGRQGLVFDAVVGRYILQFAPDPAPSFAPRPSASARAGCSASRSVTIGTRGRIPRPRSGIRSAAGSWRLCKARELNNGWGFGSTAPSLPPGLPAPELRLEAATAGGRDAPASVWAGVVRGVLPVIERLGIATAAEVDRLAVHTVREQGRTRLHGPVLAKG